MKKWIVYLHSRKGTPCGYVTANLIKDVVENAHDRMPWLHRHVIRKMVHKINNDKIENKLKKLSVAKELKINNPQGT